MVALVRWGILGAGRMADRFAVDLRKTPGIEVVAVAARSIQRAEAFAAKHSISRAYGSYELLAKDSEIDVIYVGTTHNFHKSHTLLCLENGKNVLCEKPMALNTTEARQMIACAGEKRLFLMEAMWSRFNPVYRHAMAWVNDGLIGEVRMLKADLGFRAPWEPDSRLFNPALAGGSILDVGIYSIALASNLFGSQPSEIRALAFMGETGVDEQAGIMLQYPRGQLALLSSAIQTRTPQNAFIMGTKGMIWVPMFWRARLAVLWRSRKLPRITWGSAGYQHEAAEVSQCIREGKMESETVTLAESLALMETMDQIREKIGLKYPGE
ncbi:Gfo/Idh/MocA family protein [Nitrosomonas supralitoralis]|uniref:Dehydrogenase n=1 Tax=Nitrosomonas supralitoralis TaxID=2116706 RepID=A0A2P7NXJ1_9PROT|nr:Gfo/Idh/MocA family oxidoreductase [Nitrosomonas supralitoralis]PSJ18183.1 dehydrogenase [Nitrosomonas supralitoralis]